MRLLSTLACLVGLWATTSSAQPLGWADQIEVLERSVVNLVNRNDLGEPLMSCTGWYVGANLVVTAAHCFDHPDYPLSAPEGSFVVTALDGNHDLALLEMTTTGPPLTLADDVRQGDPVLIYGYRADQALAFAGIVSLAHQRFFSTWGIGHTIDVRLLSGISGGPAINREGHVVGVALGGGHPMSPYGNLSFLAPVSDIRALTATL